MDQQQRLKRMNFNLPASTCEELRALSQRSGRSMTDIVRTGLGLANIAAVELEKSNSLAVISPDGRVLHRLVMP